MINDVIKEINARMDKSVHAFKHEITKLRTGRAHPSLLEQVHVDYYGNPTLLSQVSNISVADARSLVVSPWEKNMIPVIEKAIRQSNLGLNPVTMGDVVRVPLPPLTEERRRELIKVLRNEAETARISVRNVRRDGMTQIKTLLKEKMITEDEERRFEDQAQKATDKFIAEIDKLLSTKESDLLEV